MRLICYNQRLKSAMNLPTRKQNSSCRPLSLWLLDFYWSRKVQYFLSLNFHKWYSSFDFWQNIWFPWWSLNKIRYTCNCYLSISFYLIYMISIFSIFFYNRFFVFHTCIVFIEEYLWCTYTTAIQIGNEMWRVCLYVYANTFLAIKQWINIVH